MKNRLIFSVVMLSALIFSGCVEEELNPDVKADFDVTYAEEFENSIYPSMIFGFSELEKQENETVGYFSIMVTPNIETDIKIVVEESKLNYETIITEKDVQGLIQLNPSIKWKYDDLKNLIQPGNVDLTFVCYDENNNELGRKNLKLGYRSINECVFGVEIDGEVVSLDWMFAAYINEDSQIIDGFLKDVLQNTDLSAFTGYQRSSSEVENQVEACFLTLRDKGIKYSSITNTSNTNANIYSQYIRFSDEVLNNSQANCADGTAFFCSVLKKIGIHTMMVFVPGHVYLGYYTDDAKTNLNLLETTMVGSTASFADATDYQKDAFNSSLKKFNNDDYLDGYFVVDVDVARSFIKPIGR